MAHELDQIEVINPTEEDFTFEYGKHPYTVKAGEKKVYQRFLAWHFAKHLTNREIEKKDKGKKKSDYNNEDLRREWLDKIVIGVVEEFQPGADSNGGEKVAREQERINKEQEDRIAKLERELGYSKSKSSSSAGGKKKSNSKNAQ